MNPLATFRPLPRRWFVLGAVLLGLSAASMPVTVRANSGAFRVVVNTANPLDSASEQLLTDLFLKKRVEWPNGEAARPVDLKADSDTRREFSRSVLHRSVAAVKSYWQQMIFAGRGVPPPELASDEAVIDYVARHRGAVGYVSPSTALTGVKAISVR